MDIMDLLDGSVKEHIVLFVVLLALVVGAIVFLTRQAFNIYNSIKDFVKSLVHEVMPAKINEALDKHSEKLPTLIDEVVAARIHAHEAIEAIKMQEALQTVRNTANSEHDEYIEVFKTTSEEILSKMTKVETSLQIVHSRLEAHDARLALLEKSTVAKKRKK